jgi:hypothetical protein
MLEMQVRFNEKRKKSEDVIHDLVRAASFSAVPLEVFDRHMGSFIRKWIPASNSMPNANELRSSYLKKVFDSHFEAIKRKISGQKFSVIIDESHDLLGRKTVNTLISFYDTETHSK